MLNSLTAAQAGTLIELPADSRTQRTRAHPRLCRNLHARVPNPGAHYVFTSNGPAQTGTGGPAAPARSKSRPFALYAEIRIRDATFNQDAANLAS
jgi:hypothetical protein